MDDDDIMSGTVGTTVNAGASSSSLDGAAQDAAAATKVVTPAPAAVVKEAGWGERDGCDSTAVNAPTSIEGAQAGLLAGPKQSEAEKREERYVSLTGGPSYGKRVSHPSTLTNFLSLRVLVHRRKKSLALGVDEKKRGKRLFGGLLGTLDAFKVRPLLSFLISPFAPRLTWLRIYASLLELAGVEGGTEEGCFGCRTFASSSARRFRL